MQRRTFDFHAPEDTELLNRRQPVYRQRPERRLVLGSGSARRARILRSLGVAFEVRVPAVEEAVGIGEHERLLRGAGLGRLRCV